VISKVAETVSHVLPGGGNNGKLEGKSNGGASSAGQGNQ
jgi:hypothetical protein